MIFVGIFTPPKIGGRFFPILTFAYLTQVDWFNHQPGKDSFSKLFFSGDTVGFGGGSLEDHSIHGRKWLGSPPIYKAIWKGNDPVLGHLVTTVIYHFTVPESQVAIPVAVALAGSSD